MALMTAKELQEIKDVEWRATVRESQSVARKLVRLILKHEENLSVSVKDGEEITLRKSRDARKIVEALRTTEEDYLIVYDGTGKKRGWIWLIWSNGEEVISNCTDNPLIAGLVDEATALMTGGVIKWRD